MYCAKNKLKKSIDSLIFLAENYIELRNGCQLAELNFFWKSRPWSTELRTKVPKRHLTKCLRSSRVGAACYCPSFRNKALRVTNELAHDERANERTAEALKTQTRTMGKIVRVIWNQPPASERQTPWTIAGLRTRPARVRKPYAATRSAETTSRKHDHPASGPR